MRKNYLFNLWLDLNGLSLSELARTKLLEGLEDQIDMALYEKSNESS
ncbi:DUF6290 family protein [Vagococcus martis]|nr:DUF6290 family protein [Vagococcus martis]